MEPVQLSGTYNIPDDAIVQITGIEFRNLLQYYQNEVNSPEHQKHVMIGSTYHLLMNKLQILVNNGIATPEQVTSEK